MNGVINKNWLGYKNSMLLRGNGGNNKYYKDGVTDLIDTTGAKACCASSVFSLLSDYIQKGNTTSAGWLTVRFGTSDTPPTGEERNVGSPWPGTLSYTSVTCGSISWDGNTASRTYTVTVNSTASGSEVIREFGLFTQGRKYSSNDNCDILLYHEILETPVTLNQYESATISFTVSMTFTEPTSGWVAPT